MTLCCPEDAPTRDAKVAASRLTQPSLHHQKELQAPGNFTHKVLHLGKRVVIPFTD